MRIAAKGVTGFLPTVVTDAPDVLAAALTAARKAYGGVPGALGVHVEGPFIDPRRKGMHRPNSSARSREGRRGVIAMRAGAMVVTSRPPPPARVIARLAAGSSSASAIRTRPPRRPRRCSTPGRARRRISSTR